MTQPDLIANCFARKSISRQVTHLQCRKLVSKRLQVKWRKRLKQDQRRFVKLVKFSDYWLLLIDSIIDRTQSCLANLHISRPNPDTGRLKNWMQAMFLVWHLAHTAITLLCAIHKSMNYISVWNLLHCWEQKHKRYSPGTESCFYKYSC